MTKLKALKPKPLTLSEIVRDQLAGRALDHSSVKLTKNARGETQIEVKVGTGESGIDTIEEASAKAQTIYNELVMTYSSRGIVVRADAPAEAN